MKLLLDMNLSPRLANLLAASGVDVIHWSGVGAGTASDQEILTFAEQHGYVVVTHDLDFSAILASGHRRGPSVLQIRATDLTPERIVPMLLSAVRIHAQALQRGALLTLDVARQRVRLLPLTPDEG